MVSSCPPSVAATADSMNVGLWQLVEPAARPIALETLGNKRLAIDASIWLYQFQLAIRDSQGRALDNAHILGFLRRICKLLFYGIRPVFVFDGGAPELKRRTIVNRKYKKRQGTEDATKTAERLLSAQLREAAVKQAQNQKQKNSTGDQINEDAVYLDELDADVQNAQRSKRKADTTNNSSSVKKNKYVHRDQYDLPKLEGTLQASAGPADPRLATEEELRSFIDEMRPEDFDIDSDFFANLPTEIKYEIVGDLRIKSRQANYKRVEAMREAPTALDFSMQQIANLRERNDLTQKLLTVTDVLGQAHLSIPVRIASQRNKEYVLVKNDAEKGGGWILGVNRESNVKQEGSPKKPVVVDDSEDEISSSDDESDIFEEVQVQPTVKQITPSPNRDEQRRKAVQAIKHKYTPKSTTENPLVDDPFPSKSAAASTLFRGDSRVSPSAANGSLGNASMLSEGTPNQVAEEELGSDSLSHESLEFVDAPVFTRDASTATALPGRASPPALPPDEASLVPRQEARNLDKATDSIQSPNDSRSFTPSVDTLQHPTSNFQSPEADRSSRNGTPTGIPVGVNDWQGSHVLDQATTRDRSILPQSTISGTFPRAQGATKATEFEHEPRLEEPTTLKTDAYVQDRKNYSAEAVEDHPFVAKSQEMSPTVSASEPLESSRRTDKEDIRPVSGHTSGSATSVEWSPSPESGVLESQPITESNEALVEGVDFSNVDGIDQAAENTQHPDISTDLNEEQNQFAGFFSQVQHRNLDDIQHEIQNELKTLQQQQKKDRRSADEVTAQMSKEIKLMLRYFGIPYVEAPMEAEAQCAELLSHSLVDGIITDDSDVFLFGGSRIYRNFFNQAKYVECYLLSDLERELSLSREQLVRLAYFLGSDYVEGISGVGPVTGMELMAEFPGETGLLDFRDWWKRVQKGKDDTDDNRSAFRRRFKKSMKNLLLDDAWPNPAVLEAYYNPTVDESELRFQWGIPDLDALRGYLGEYLGWSVTKVDDTLLPIIKRMTDRGQGIANMQTSLEGFFDISGGTGHYAPRGKMGFASRRLQKVVEDWRASQKTLKEKELRPDTTNVAEELIGKVQGKKRPTVRRLPVDTSTTAMQEEAEKPDSDQVGEDEKEFSSHSQPTTSTRTRTRRKKKT